MCLSMNFGEWVRLTRQPQTPKGALNSPTFRIPSENVLHGEIRRGIRRLQL